MRNTMTNGFEPARFLKHAYQSKMASLIGALFGEWYAMDDFDRHDDALSYGSTFFSLRSI